MATPTTQLTETQIGAFQRDGFLGLDAITTVDELVWLRETYDRLFVGKVGWDDGNQFDLAGTDADDTPSLPQILRPSQYAPELLNAQYLKNAREIARQILGDEMLPGNGEHMIYKPAGIGAATPWHQDQAYHDPNTLSRGINFWMPLDDASVESGCLQFVPGTHEMDVLPHHPIGNDPRVHGLEVDDPLQWRTKSVACPLPAGGASLHAAFMLHYAGPNNTGHPRRAYTLTFRLPAVKRDVPVDNYWSRSQKTARAERSKRAQGSQAEGRM